MSNQLCKVKRLYIQAGDDCFPSPDTAAFVEAVKQDTWEAGEERYMYVIEGNMPSSIDKEELLLNTIPIGSVEFVQNFLKQNSLPPLKAVNVPPELNDVRFLSRKVWNLDSKNELPVIVEKYSGKLVVKPGQTPKLFDTTTTRYLHEIPDGEPLFISEFLSDIHAEWRAFVLQGRIRSIRPYMLRRWVCPDRAMVEEMAKLVSLPSCTIDVAVLSNGQTVLIEVHPFISCGLYGFEGPDLLRMVSAAWNHQIQSM